MCSALLAEKTRLYQAAVEARRILRERAEGLVSFDADLEAADAEVAKAEAEMTQAWCENALAAT